MTLRRFHPLAFWKIIASSIALIFCTGCGEIAGTRRTLRETGVARLRTEALALSRDGFKSGVSQEVPKESWTSIVQAFQPLSFWAEPDGAYLLLFSDAEGERGIYVPRILSEKDPLCSPTLRHEKLGEGVYWYEKKRS
jgi:hypothetical protein